MAPAASCSWSRCPTLGSCACELIAGRLRSLKEEKPCCQAPECGCQNPFRGWIVTTNTRLSFAALALQCLTGFPVPSPSHWPPVFRRGHLSCRTEAQVSSSLSQTASPLRFPSDHLCEVTKGGSHCFNSCCMCSPFLKVWKQFLMLKLVNKGFMAAWELLQFLVHSLQKSGGP